MTWVREEVHVHINIAYVYRSIATTYFVFVQFRLANGAAVVVVSVRHLLLSYAYRNATHAHTGPIENVNIIKSIVVCECGP